MSTRPKWLDLAFNDEPAETVAVGAHLESGWPCLTVERPGDWGGPGIPRQEFILAPALAARVGMQLLAAGDPSLVLDVLRGRLEEAAKRRDAEAERWTEAARKLAQPELRGVLEVVVTREAVEQAMPLNQHGLAALAGAVALLREGEPVTLRLTPEMLRPLEGA